MLERAAKKLKDPKLRARREAAWRKFKALDRCVNDDDRRKRLALDPDPMPDLIATKILGDMRLEDYERRYAAEIISPRLVAALLKKPKKKRVPRATAIALKADHILECYFEYCALHPQDKHKDHALPAVAKECDVSVQYIDEWLGKLNPARRKEMEKRAASWAKFYKLFHEDWKINGPPLVHEGWEISGPPPGTVTP
jgi:hypothetical protein